MTLRVSWQSDPRQIAIAINEALRRVSGYPAAPAGTAPASYTQAQMQAVLDRIAALEARLS